MTTARKEPKIQMIPTVTQPVKNDLENIYFEPYNGIGQRIKKNKVLPNLSVGMKKARADITHRIVVAMHAILKARLSFFCSASKLTCFFLAISSRAS